MGVVIMSCKCVAENLFKLDVSDFVRKMSWITIESMAKCLSFEVDEVKCKDCPMFLRKSKKGEREREKSSLPQCPKCGGEMEPVSVWGLPSGYPTAGFGSPVAFQKWKCKKCGKTFVHLS